MLAAAVNQSIECPAGYPPLEVGRSTTLSPSAGPLRSWVPTPAARGTRERSGRYALSLRGIREVQPHLSPDRGDGDNLWSHGTGPLSTAYCARSTQRRGLSTHYARPAAGSPQCHRSQENDVLASLKNAPQLGPRGKY